MRIVRNKFIPFKGFKCINLFGVLFVREECRLTDCDLNHEAIHTAQMKELWYIPFYILYLTEWFARLFMKGNSYRNISFEREAYANEDDMGYLGDRKKFGWKEYLRGEKKNG